jgi:hypothetical protein
VVRQETHFQPVALEARRILGMTAGAPVQPVAPEARRLLGMTAGAPVQPMALEARRLLGMTAGAPDDRVLPLALAAATKLTRPQAPPHESQGEPALSDRAGEAAGPLATASVAGPETPTPGSIGQQVADGVQRALASPAEPSAPRSVSTADPAAPPAYAPVVRSIKLQLNPVSLGVVTIVLTGSEGEMRVHLEAERAETFGKVEHERAAISARLNGAGYAITELTVGRMAAADTPARDGDRQGGQTGGQAGGQHGDTSGNGARDGGAQFADQRAGRHSAERATRADGAAASAVKGPAAEQVVTGVSHAGRFRPV